MSTVSAIPGYYTLSEAAEHIGVSISQISRYISTGQLKALDLGHQMLIEQRHVHNFRRPRRGNPTFYKQAKKTS